ncbi:WD40/YVTN repeat-like-containing domain, partial [Striga asiatica]
MAGRGSSSKRESSKRKREKTSSQKKSRSKKQKRAYNSDSSYSNEESLSPEPTSKSEHKKKIRKKKKLSSGHSTSSSSSYSDRSVSSDSDSSSSGYRRKKAKRSRVIVKSTKKLSRNKSTRSGRKPKRSRRDDSAKPKIRSSKKKTQKYISHYSGSDSESCSTCQSTSSSSSEDSEPKTSKMVLDKERKRFRGRNSYEDREKLERGSKHCVSAGHDDVALSPVINNSRRLKSVIAFADHRYDDDEEVEKSRWAMNPHEEEIVYDQNDYPSLKSPDSNEEGTKMELGDQSHGNLSKMIGVKDVVDDNVDKGKEVDDKSVLESILRQRALENLKKYKGRLQTGQTSLNLEMNEKDNAKMPPDVTTVSSDFQKTNQNSGPSQKSDLSQTTDAKSLLVGENIDKEHGIIVQTAEQLNDGPPDKYINSDVGLNKTVSNSEPSSSSVGEHKLERENEAKDGSFEQKTMTVMRGGEMVQVREFLCGFDYIDDCDFLFKKIDSWNWYF